MKWITPLWSDPVGWSEWLAKTRKRVLVWSVVHITSVLCGLVMICWSLEKLHDFQEVPSLRILAVLSGATPIILFGIAYPACYLYALHRLLLQLKSERDQSKQE